MHQYWYVNAQGSGQPFNNHFSVTPFYSQSQIPNHGRINGLGFPNGWRGRVYPEGWKSPGGGRRVQAIHSTSPASQMNLPAQESSGWITQVEIEGVTPHGHNEGTLIQIVDQDEWESKVVPANNWPQPIDHVGSASQKKIGHLVPLVDQDDWESQEPPAIWPQLPNHQWIASKGQFTSWAQPVNQAGLVGEGQPLGGGPTASHAGFNPYTKPVPWKQPTHHAGMMNQGHSTSGAPFAGQVGFNSQNHPFPWAHGFNHQGMHPQGHFAAMQPPFSNPFGFGANGKPGNFGGFGNPPAWGGQGNPMGWGNNGGNGQPGIFDGLLKMGKGTMNGIGILSSLISVGKFLF